ncbi:hypothetical protein [Specibacter sp. NPDC078709]|uniref:hypothetical protein n=1 Tax=Specibacter sp. NPDC078709 TaxID=3154364 RepID=UPI003412927F
MSPLSDPIDGDSLWTAVSSKSVLDAALTGSELPSDAGLSALKYPRRADDSLIITLDADYQTRSRVVAMKLHPDLFPIGNQIYAQPDALRQICASGAVVSVYESRVLELAGLRPVRAILFEFIRGIHPREAFIKFPGEANRIFTAVHDCNQAIFRSGFHPIVKDETDYVLQRYDTGIWSCWMTDYNALIDIREVHSSVREVAASRVNRIFDKLISQNSPYQGVAGSATW